MGEELNKNINFNLGVVIGLILIAAGFFFFSPALTGNAISDNINPSFSNLIGIGLLFIGLIVSYLSIKGKNKPKRRK
jgi:uncharacterized membrane protein (DUF441 family)